jgi:hypothetical protein
VGDNGRLEAPKKPWDQARASTGADVRFDEFICDLPH